MRDSMTRTNRLSAFPRRGILRHALVAATLAFMSLRVAPALAADATLTGLGNGLYNTVQGSAGGNPVETYYYVGTLTISIDGGPGTAAYCIELTNPLSVGETQPQVPPDYPCEVVHILNNAFPNPSTIPTPLADANSEAAAVQSAIWHFTDGFAVTAPADVVTRASAIVAAAENQCAQVPAVPQTLFVSPAEATNYLPTDTSHGVTATLLDSNGNPIPGHTVDVVVTGAAGPQSFQGSTDVLGQLAVSYSNTFVVTGTDTITASASFTVPVGFKFKAEGKQAIVVAGMPQPGTVTGTATKHWVPARCGDGVVNQPGEQCDDGNLVDGDGCDANCTPTGCGNGIVTPPEQCDDGNLLDGDGCDTNCTSTGCGNGIVTVGEQCDDGNRVNGDSCDNNCTTTRCGNGIVTPPEQCDDGDTVNGDGCDNNCTTTGCGNGVPTPPEQCDDGNTINGDGCDNNCTAPGCGNGIVTPPEQCDDGNTINGDGCDNNCKTTGCGNGIVTPPEECDDGNLLDGDSCEADCSLPRCGNGIVDPGEQCDDGNLLDGDGCDVGCRLQEICFNLEDDDGDGVIDCEDADCDCQPIRKDPAAISFYKTKPDRLVVHGYVIPSPACEPETGDFGVLLTNPNGTIYEGHLIPGDLIRKGKRYTFRDHAAKSGQGTHDGLAKVRMVRGSKGRLLAWFTAYGDLDRATLPTMTLQLNVCGETFFTKGVWKRSGRGWRLGF